MAHLTRENQVFLEGHSSADSSMRLLGSNSILDYSASVHSGKADRLSTFGNRTYTTDLSVPQVEEVKMATSDEGGRGSAAFPLPARANMGGMVGSADGAEYSAVRRSGRSTVLQADTEKSADGENRIPLTVQQESLILKSFG